MKLSILAYNLIVAVAVAGVVQLDSSSFNQAILSNDYSTSFVAFTAPWCGHCQRLHAPLNQAANSLDGLVSFYNVVCLLFTPRHFPHPQTELRRLKKLKHLLKIQCERVPHAENVQSRI